LDKLGYKFDETFGAYRHPDNRQVIYLGDYVDRCDDPVGVLNIVMSMCEKGSAQAVVGNHDQKCFRALKGNKVKLNHGLEKTIEELNKQTPEYREKVKNFLGSLPYELILADGLISASHAGLPEDLQGKDNDKARSQALYGKTTGKIDPVTGFPERLDWAKDYTGFKWVFHGHTPMLEHRILNKVVCLDTGVPFGNYLTSINFPTMTVTKVKALAEYQPYRPFGGVTTDGA